MVSIIQNEMLFSRRPISNHPEQSQMAMHAKYILWEICFLFPVCLVYIYYVYPYILYPFQHPFHHFAIPSSCIPKDIGGKWAECETGSLFHCMVLVRAFTSYPSSDFGMYSYWIKIKNTKISLIIFLFGYLVQNKGLWILLWIWPEFESS